MHRYLAVAGLFLASCSCSGGTASGGGPTPYVRCAAAEAAVIDRQIGSLHARSSGRVLTVDGATTPLRVAVFRGAALADEPIAPALDSIEALRPAIAVVLGSIGDEAHATALVEALAQLAIPTLVVLGGRDRQDVLARAIADLPSSSAGLVVDVSPYRSVQIAGMELIPAAGAPDGRYAVDDAACGLGPADVESIVAEVGSSGTQRFLIGFAGPSPRIGGP